MPCFQSRRSSSLAAVFERRRAHVGARACQSLTRVWGKYTRRGKVPGLPCFAWVCFSFGFIDFIGISFFFLHWRVSRWIVLKMSLGYW